jgi:hypothetical protein
VKENKEGKGIWFEMDGKLYTDGGDFSVEDSDFVDSTDADPNEDPEGWRRYADNITAAQIAWLKKNPEHDWGGVLDRQRAKGLLTEEEIRFIESRPRYSEKNEEVDVEDE